MDRLRQENIRNREKAIELMRNGTPAAVENFWRAHLERMRDLVLSAYEGPMTIDVLKLPTGKLRPVGNVRRRAPSAA